MNQFSLSVAHLLERIPRGEDSQRAVRANCGVRMGQENHSQLGVKKESLEKPNSQRQTEKEDSKLKI